MKSVSSRLGKKIIELAHVSKAFDGVPVIMDFSYNVLRDDRIGIIGENGSGKSKLLKLCLLYTSAMGTVSRSRRRAGSKPLMSMIRSVRQNRRFPNTVSYTHLDVYKRQLL